MTTLVRDGVHTKLLLLIIGLAPLAWLVIGFQYIASTPGSFGAYIASFFAIIYGGLLFQFGQYVIRRPNIQFSPHKPLAVKLILTLIAMIISLVLAQMALEINQESVLRSAIAFLSSIVFITLSLWGLKHLTSTIVDSSSVYRHERFSSVPKSVSPFSHLTIGSNIATVSGLIGQNKEGHLVGDSFKSQARQTLDNLIDGLKEVGFNKEQILHIRVYLLDYKHFDTLDELFKEYFPSNRPARTTIAVCGLPLPDAKIQIDAILDV